MDVDKKKPSTPGKAAPAPASTGEKGHKALGGKVIARAGNRRTLWKNAFDSPFTVHWNPVGTEAQQQVIGALSSVLKDMPKRSKVSDSEGDKQQDKSKFREELVFGLNAVTRALEKDEVQLVVCTRDLTPARALQHIPVLCAFRTVPLCPISMTSQAFAELMGESAVRSVICMAFKRTKSTHFKEAISVISSKCPKLDIPWAPSKEALPSINATVDSHIQGASSMKNQRKVAFTRLKVRKIEHTAPQKLPKAPQPSAKKQAAPANAAAPKS